MNKKTTLSILIGAIAGYMLAVIAMHIVFVFKMAVCIMALRYLFSEFSDAD